MYAASLLHINQLDWMRGGEFVRIIERYRGCLLGLAAGDALGAAVEFRARGSFEPITDMIGGGPFDLAVGQWTDDTSMALCLACSLLEQEGFDPVDQIWNKQHLV